MTELEAGLPADLTAGRVGVKSQYIKDLSFEVPRAPVIFLGQRSGAKLVNTLDIKAAVVVPEADLYEVLLRLTLKATNPEQMGGPVEPIEFVGELVYGGLFSLEGIEPEDRQEALFVDCPHILYPFAGNILSDLCRDANFPPLALPPVDFLQLWQNNKGRRLGV